MKKIKLQFMVVPEELERLAYVPDPVRVKIIDPEAIFLTGLLGESGRELVKAGVHFYFTEELAQNLIEKGIAAEVELYRDPTTKLLPQERLTIIEKDQDLYVPMVAELMAHIRALEEEGRKLYHAATEGKVHLVFCNSRGGVLGGDMCICPGGRPYKELKRDYDELRASVAAEAERKQ